MSHDSPWQWLRGFPHRHIAAVYRHKGRVLTQAVIVNALGNLLFLLPHTALNQNRIIGKGIQLRQLYALYHFLIFTSDIREFCPGNEAL